MVETKRAPLLLYEYSYELLYSYMNIHVYSLLRQLTIRVRVNVKIRHQLQRPIAGIVVLRMSYQPKGLGFEPGILL